MMTRGDRCDALKLYALFFVAFLYGPVLLLPMFSFNDSIYIAFPLKAFTTKWYAEMVGNAGLIQAFANSIKVATAVSLVSTALGLAAAKAVTRYPMPGRAPITSMLMLPMVVPSVIFGISLLLIVRLALDLPLSLWTVSAGHVLLCVPLSMLVLISRFEGFDKSLEEASLDLGESGWSTFWRVTFPLVLPGVVSSLLLCFTASFDEFVIAFFLSGTEATLPIFIYSQLRFPAKLPGVLALGSCILVTSFTLVVVAELIRRRGATFGKV